MADNQIKVLLLEEQQSAEQSVQAFLAGEQGVCLETREVVAVDEHAHDGRFDVILLDLNFDSDTKIEVFDAVRSTYPGVPVVVLTAQADEASGIKAVQLGAQDFLIKGETDRKLLLRAIRYAIERNQLLEQLQESRRLGRHLAYYDGLTDLPNRLLFQDRLHQAVAQARRFDQDVALLFLDLDGFKRINDTLGHSVGDLLLKAVAKRLTEHIREVDTIARVGGDEFTIILLGIHGVGDAAQVAQKILEIVSRPFRVEEHELYITASIGISLYPYDGEEIDGMLKKAEIAMYRAKAHGKSRYEVYKLSMDAQFAQYLTLEGNLRKAIERNQLTAYYQPQVDLRSGEICGVEALVRWQHPEFGLIQPRSFVPLAEETGLIVQVDEWVLRHAAAQMRRWHEEGFSELRLAVNLSARQFHDKRLPHLIENILRETGLAVEHLCLEITESHFMQNGDGTIEMLDTLKQMGMQLSVDDFGTGYSSLNYLKRFPVDILKIARTFVKGIPIDRDDTAISTAIVVLAQSMNLTVVAEGVETRKQLDYLRRLQCDEIQGFYFSRPVPAEMMSEMLANNRRLF
ncbi:MAG: EAL domain-containing protein [Calditrichaeota bacterium]|nr:MAG: EAL domain-containing protein [Calditrichota bacterium]